MLTAIKFNIRSGYPEMSDLPWDLPLSEWDGCCPRLEEVPHGLSRHPVVFVNYGGTLFVLKEMQSGAAEKEFEALCQIEELRLPAVTPVGTIQVSRQESKKSILVTRHLENSLPYRSLFMRSSLVRYREHLLDAMAGLLVQLHLAGVFWGDCSLSNTLFRRDAGALQAYLVDAETCEVSLPRLMPTLRHHDLEIMETNIEGDLAELAAARALPGEFPLTDTGDYIRKRYRSLWDEITQEKIISPGETYRVQEHIRALNALGFSVRDVEIQPTENGDKLRLRVFVTDRNFHHDLLLGLTGMDTQELQARQMVNEIREYKARLSHEQNRDVPLSIAANQWFEQSYQPVMHHLAPLFDRAQRSQVDLDPAELYCQVLEHKWFLSERARQDVGHQAAAEDYLQNAAPDLHFRPA